MTHQARVARSLIVQCKVLTPNDFADLADLADLAAVERRLLTFQERHEQLALPFDWTFTRSG